MIRFENVSMAYGTNEIIHNLNLKIEEGQPIVESDGGKYLSEWKRTPRDGSGQAPTRHRLCHTGDRIVSPHDHRAKY